MDQLFGTDGIRGVAGSFPLDEATVFAIGASFSRQMRERLGREPRLVSGRDTRESGAAIESAFHRGAESIGAECESAGVITTPGVAFLTGAFRFDAGIVVSASHNPFQDNGIKIFAPDGKKVGEDIERAIEADIAAAANLSSSVAAGELHCSRSDEFYSAYLEHLRSYALPQAAKTKLVIDCANGAASSLAPQLFSSLGFDTIVLNDKPDGRNINLDCGSLHLEHLQKAVVERSADIGVAFDGDADRALFVDENGKVVDGDATLWILARHLRSHGKLQNSKVVATVMSNIGLEIAFRDLGINLLRAKVGDKYVLEMLIGTGSEIGGEQSGHIIFPEISLVGDGMMTAILILNAIGEQGTSLSTATDGFDRFPQTLVNVKVAKKLPFETVPAISEAASEIERSLAGSGRLLLRYSGTENLARVMIEGKDQTEIEAQANHLADVIRKSLG